MLPGKSTYHHPNLEAALLDAAAKIVDTQGVAALSLRALGEAAGVSRSAAYHYFADKDALLHRLGERGFERLAAATAAAGQGITDPFQRGRAALLAYLHFAQANPRLFRLMFAGVLPRRLQLPLGPEGAHHDFSSTAAASAFAALLAGVAELPGNAGLEPNLLMLRTNAIWAAVHGVAVLAIDENLKLVDAETVLTALLDMILADH